MFFEIIYFLNLIPPTLKPVSYLRESCDDEKEKGELLWITSKSSKHQIVARDLLSIVLWIAYRYQRFE
jgi:hypothetical protein